MHVHVAIFKWKDGVEEARLEEALEQIRSVANRVEGILGIYCGENTSKWNQGFTHAVVVLGKTAQSIEAYRHDDVHEVAARYIESIELDGIGIDFKDLKI